MTTNQNANQMGRPIQAIPGASRRVVILASPPCEENNRHGIVKEASVLPADTARRICDTRTPAPIGQRGDGSWRLGVQSLSVAGDGINGRPEKDSHGETD